MMELPGQNINVLFVAINGGIRMLNLKRHVKARMQEVEANRDQEQFYGPGDMEALLPILKELLDRDVRCFIIALETRDGIILTHRSRNSEHLLEAL